MSGARRPTIARRAGQFFLVALLVLSASVFAFSVVGIAGVGAGATPTPAVLDAAEDAAREAERARGGWWDGDGSYRRWRDGHPCRKQRERAPQTRRRIDDPRLKS